MKKTIMKIIEWLIMITLPTPPIPWQPQREKDKRKRN